VAEFVARLKDAVDLDAVQADLTSAVQQTLVFRVRSCFTV
jgi:hypothetical protein